MVKISTAHLRWLTITEEGMTPLLRHLSTFPDSSLECVLLKLSLFPTSAIYKVLSVVLCFPWSIRGACKKTFGLLQEHKCFASLDLRYLAIPRAAFLGGFFLQHFGSHLHFLTSFSFLFFFSGQCAPILCKVASDFIYSAYWLHLHFWSMCVLFPGQCVPNSRCKWPLYASKISLHLLISFSPTRTTLCIIVK